MPPAPTVPTLCRDPDFSILNFKNKSVGTVWSGRGGRPFNMIQGRPEISRTGDSRTHSGLFSPLSLFGNLAASPRGIVAKIKSRDFRGEALGLLALVGPPRGLARQRHLLSREFIPVSELLKAYHKRGNLSFEKNGGVEDFRRFSILSLC